MSSSHPTLPQELVDAVIDLCASDMAVLLVCSLVSVTWVSASRKHLFHHLDPTREGQTRMESLLLILSSHLETITPALRHLELVVSHEGFRDHGLIPPLIATGIRIPTLSLFFRSDERGEEQTTSFIPAIRHWGPYVSTLRISCSLDRHVSLPDLIPHFPHLENLWFQGSITPGGSIPPSVRSLTIQVEDPGPLFVWLTEDVVSDVNLESLRIQPVSSYSLDDGMILPLHQFLSKVAVKLTSLTLESHCESDPFLMQSRFVDPCIQLYASHYFRLCLP